MTIQRFDECLDHIRALTMELQEVREDIRYRKLRDLLDNTRYIRRAPATPKVDEPVVRIPVAGILRAG